MKRLFQVASGDWASFLFPEFTEIKLTDMQTDIVAKIKQKSELDFIKLINSQYILHLEPMGYKDKSLPIRMLRYMADILEYLSGPRR
jgi:hypothetical protein